MTRLISTIMALLAVFAIAAPAAAEKFTVKSVTTTDLGNVVSASSGDTVFRANPANGVVTKVSGAGDRLSSGSARSLVTIKCNNNAKCNTKDASVTISFTGSPTNRAGVLGNFKVSTSGATATIVNPPGSGSSITFTIGPVGRKLTKTFWLGFDFPILGDNSGGPTGLSTSEFVVTVSRARDGKKPHSRVGTAQGIVFRSLAIAKTADLAFGTIIRPSTGSGIVSVNAVTGAVTVTGTGTTTLGTSSSAAEFSITGEGGQSISVFVPSSIVMTGPSGSLTVTTVTDPAAPSGLSNSLGLAGALDLNVGGAFNISSSTTTGAYSGVLAVTAQYN